jgi:hypothetical protein
LTRQKVFVILENKKYKVVNAIMKKGEWKIPKGIQETAISLEPGSILEEDKPFWKIWRNPKRLAILFQGNIKTASVENKPKNFDMGFLSIDDVLKFVKSVVIKAMASIKPIKTSYFLLLLFATFINIAVTLWGFSRMGVI